MGEGAPGDLSGPGRDAPAEVGMQEVLEDVGGILRRLLPAACVVASLLMLWFVLAPPAVALPTAVAIVALALSRHRDHRAAPLVLLLPAIVCTATFASLVFDDAGCQNADFATNRKTTEVPRTWPLTENCHIVAADGSVSRVSGEVTAYFSVLACGLLIGVLLGLRGHVIARLLIAVVASFATLVVMFY